LTDFASLVYFANVAYSRPVKIFVYLGHFAEFSNAAILSRHVLSANPHSIEVICLFPTVRDRQDFSQKMLVSGSENFSLDFRNHSRLLLKPCIGKEAQMKKNKWPLYTGVIGAAAIFSMQATMPVSRTHSKSYLFSLSFVDQSQRSPSLAPLYLCRALIVAPPSSPFKPASFQRRA